MAAAVATTRTTANKPAANANALKKGTTVNFWIMPNGPQPQADMEKTVKPFEDQTGVKVNVEVVGWDVQLDRIKNAAVSGQGPDVTQAGTTQVPFFAALGGFANLQDRVGDIGGKAAYAPGVWQTTQLQGTDGTYAVPWFTEARAIYYRKDALNKAGIDPATAFTDVNAFQQTLQTIKDKVPRSTASRSRPSACRARRHSTSSTTSCRSCGTTAAAELIADARSRPSTARRPGASTLAPTCSRTACSTRACSSATARRSRTSSRAADCAVWTAARGCWPPSAHRRQNWVAAARKNVGVAAMPTGPAGKAFTFVGGSNLMMFKASKNQNEAWALIKYLSSDAVQKNYADLLSFFPARLAPQEQVGNSDDNHKAFFAAIKEGRTYAPIAQWGQIENAYKGRFGNILDSAAGQGKKPFSQGEVKSQLDAAAKEADALLAQGG